MAPQAQFTELTTDPSLFSQAVYSEQLLLRNLVTGAPLKQKVFAPQKVFVSHWQAFELTVAPLVMEQVVGGRFAHVLEEAVQYMDNDSAVDSAVDSATSLLFFTRLRRCWILKGKNSR